MVIRLSVQCCVLMMLLWRTVTAAELQLLPDATQVEYGKPVWLSIISTQQQVSLQTLDFSNWEEDVAVLRDRDVETDTVAGTQQWRVRLYPRREGIIELPGLLFAGNQTPALRLHSTAPLDPKASTPINITCQPSVTKPYQLQQVVVGCDVLMDAEHALFDYPRQVLSDAQLLPMQVQRSAEGQQTRHQAGWVVIPQRSGGFVYDLPPLQLQRDGVITHRFYLPRLNLQVRPLPLYLPGTVPVGEVRVTRYALSGFVLAPASLSDLVLQVEAHGIPAEALPDYALRVSSDSVLQTYPAKRQHTQQVDAQGLHQFIEYTIPVTPRRQGLYRLPDLRLQYFDPHSGTLRTQYVPGTRAIILGGWARLVLLLLALAGVLAATGYVYRWFARRLRRLRIQRAALAVLQSDPDPTQLRRAMQLMAQAEGWSANLTYRQWQNKMAALRKPVAEFSLRELYEASYAGAVHDLRALQQQLQSVCRRRMYRL